LEQGLLGDFHESYLPLGTLRIESFLPGRPTNYCRTLDLEQALCTVDFTQGDAKVSRRYFLSYPDKVLVVEFRADKEGDYALSFDSQLNFRPEQGKWLLFSGLAPSRVEPNYKKCPNPVVYDKEHPGMPFAFGLRYETDGEASEKNGCLIIQKAKSFTLYCHYRTGFQGFDQAFLDKADVLRRVEEHLERLNPDKLFERHIRDYQPLFKACSLSLDSKKDDRPTDERLMDFHPDDRGLVELLFHFGRYLLIASSRKGSQAANLQGIWNPHLRAPWSSNYTLNINAQMNYWGAMAANLASCALPAVALAAELSEAGKLVAQEVHGAKGWCAHHNADLWRSSMPVGNREKGSACYGYFPLGGAWMARTAFEYYLYTQDEAFLKETLYSLYQGIVDFILDCLIKDTSGKFIMCPAASPENHFVQGKDTLAVSKYSACMQSICHDALDIYPKIRECLSLPPDERAQAVLDNLQGLEIGQDGRLLEWDREYLEAEPNHRHLSHLYALFPGRSIAPDSALGKACRASLENRGDDGTGWSLAWKVNLWARLHDGERAHSLILRQLKYTWPSAGLTMLGGGSYPNLFCAHPPFQIDGNFGVLSGILEMLVQVLDGKIILLPALPKAWPNGEIRGMKLPGNIRLSMRWKDGTLEDVVFESPTALRLSVRYLGQDLQDMDLVPGESFVYRHQSA
jgi:alpha-L-fucosidase 2